MIDRAKPLIEKLADVMAQVERVPKNGYNDFFKYKYVMEADLVAHIRPLLASAGIMIVPSVQSEEIEFGVIQERGGASHLARLMVEYTVTDGKDSIHFNIPGYGVDKSDKSVYKAMTGSMKYALMKLFLVDTGDDPEASGMAEQTSQGVSISSSNEEGIGKGGHPQKTSRYQLQRITATMREKGMQRVDLLAIIAEVHGVELVMPETDEEAQKVILQYLSDLENVQAGELISKLDEWTDTNGAA